MRAQIRGLDQASRNGQDGISLIQTAEGAMSTINEMVVRIRELVIQASNDTNVHNTNQVHMSDRVKIQDEIRELVAEIDKTVERTEFNTRKLIDGSLDPSQTVFTWQNAPTWATIRAELNPANPGNFVVGADSDTNDPSGFSVAQQNVIASIISGNAGVFGLTAGTAAISATWVINNLSGADLEVLRGASPIAGTAGAPSTGGAVGSPSSQDTVAGTVGTQGTVGELGTAGTPLKGGFNGGTFAVNSTAANSLADRIATYLTTFVANTNLEAQGGQGSELWFQVGANANQGVSLQIARIGTDELEIGNGAGRPTIDVERVSGEAIQAAYIDLLDRALSTVTTERSKLGAMQNRLEYTIENLDIASENLSAANSRIRDADMAKEMMRLTQANVLQQAATAMLAQANQAPQSVLQLLG
jgi:flagellin